MIRAFRYLSLIRSISILSFVISKSPLHTNPGCILSLQSFSHRRLPGTPPCMLKCIFSFSTPAPLPETTPQGLAILARFMDADARRVYVFAAQHYSSTFSQPMHTLFLRSSRLPFFFHSFSKLSNPPSPPSARMGLPVCRPMPFILGWQLTDKQTRGRVGEEERFFLQYGLEDVPQHGGGFVGYVSVNYQSKPQGNV
jgi:hypothetical protein